MEVLNCFREMIDKVKNDETNYSNDPDPFKVIEKSYSLSSKFHLNLFKLNLRMISEPLGTLSAITFPNIFFIP